MGIHHKQTGTGKISGGRHQPHFTHASECPCPRAAAANAEIEINGAALILADALPPEYPPTSSLIHLYVPDCDAVCAQAMAAGATSVAESADQFYGDRLARITDPHNNQWSISTHIEDQTPDQVAQRLAELRQG